MILGTVSTCPQVKSLGYFEDEAAAAREYDRALVEVRGLLQARQLGLNFPEEITAGDAGVEVTLSPGSLPGVLQ